MKKWINASLLMMGVVTVQAAVTVSNLDVSQREGTKLVDIHYDASSDATNSVTVSVVITNGAAEVNAPSLSGDVGSGVATGSLKQIIWDSGADWDSGFSELTFTLSAISGEEGISASAPLAKTGQTASYQAGDDGGLLKGTEWPSPRFIDNGDGTITDNMTGLGWHHFPQIIGAKNWYSAVDYCHALSYAGHGDWRLPSAKEVLSLLDYGRNNPALPLNHPFFGSPGWTSTVTTFNTNRMWVVNGNAGYMTNDDGSKTFPVWPVRTESGNGSSPVVKTGQTTSYRAGDDGFNEAGSSWPTARFADHGDGTTTDLLTGLQWVSAPQSLMGNSGMVAWSNAVAFCNSLDHANSEDWRLPNIRELESLVHYGKGTWGNYPRDWLNSTNTPISGIEQAYYWSSTTYAPNTNRSLAVSMALGNIAGYDKIFSSEYVWPVRGESTLSTAPVRVTDSGEVDSRDYSFSISSPYGTPIPSIGTHSNYAWRSTVTGWVDGVISLGGTNYTCSGWNGTGSVPVLGSATNTGAILLTELSSSIDWRWIVDADSDRMPDDWELLYFGSETAGVATNDVDGDGYLNWQEYILGSNPTNGGSSFLFTPSPTQPTNTAFSIDFTTVTGRLYTVECTDELGSGNWQVLTNFIGDGSTTQIIDPANIPACFYQIRIDWAE